ncbi:MAG: hypothetical protein FWG87_11285 [Defluviitaleaceae bacterium]|nr:hypothetical protein [Defluviitaleaceae bacterium]
MVFAGGLKGVECGFLWVWRIFADLRGFCSCKLRVVERRFYLCELGAIKRGFGGFTQIYADFIRLIGFSWEFPASQSA